VSSQPLLVVLSGPSGVGKDAILQRLRELGAPFHYTVTATTRAPRAGEIDGHGLYFLSPGRFDQLLQEDGLLEHARVYGHYYGVPKAPVLEALASGQDVIMRTNVEGAASIRRRAPGAVLIFVTVPSIAMLQARLTKRGQNSETDMGVRLATVQDEMSKLGEFDYVVENAEGQLDQCVETVKAIVRAEKCRVSRPAVGIL
jgi:guanylate kinase